jgi:hypothetical protein
LPDSAPNPLGAFGADAGDGSLGGAEDEADGLGLAEASGAATGLGQAKNKEVIPKIMRITDGFFMERLRKDNFNAL